MERRIVTMALELIKISKQFAVNPNDVIAVQVSKETLETVVVVRHLPTLIKSEYTFEETLMLLTGQVKKKLAN